MKIKFKKKVTQVIDKLFLCGAEIGKQLPELNPAPFTCFRKKSFIRTRTHPFT